MDKAEKAIVVVFKSKGMGETSAQELKEKLASKFLYLLNDSQMLPKVICFYTDGVHLVCEGSPLLDTLKQLEDKGVRLVVCKTCLDFFGLADRLRIGVVGGMGDIIAAMWQADSVITV